MKRTYTLISQDPTKLLEMLSLRRAGWTFVSLSDFYHCDRTSLRYQCRKYQVFPIKTKFVKNSSEVFDPKRIAHHIIITINPPVFSKWIIVDGEKINKGKTYADYIK